MNNVVGAATTPALAAGLITWRDRHYGATIVVCGCGPSLHELTEPSRFVTIGVNDVGRLFDPTYLVVINPRSQFKGDRFRYVEHSQAQAVFTQLDLGQVRPPVVRFRLGQYAGTDIGESDVLPYTQNSPYVAVCLAAYMGARRIGLLGVDFTDHHFFASTGRHPLAGRLAQIDREYEALARALAARGVELVNLSAHSRLTGLRKVGVAWMDDAQAKPPAPMAASPKGMRIVSYATTPVAGVPSVLARCIDAATEHSAQCVWAGGSYGNGVAFAGGTSWRRHPQEALALLDAADVVIVHNGKIDPAHAKVLHAKPLVTMAHNYGWNVDMQHVRRGLPGVVVAQYQATLPEFAGWDVVPNPVPLWEPEHAAGAKSDQIHIAYTPSGRHERYAASHRLYWHGKGWDSTMAVLHRLAGLPEVRIETTEHGQISHEQSLAMKRRAHIVIDECVTGSYHRNSLEGLAAGAVVINGVGLLPGVEQALRVCAPDAGALPFVFSTLDDLEQTLRGLIDRGAAALVADGRRNRAWMERHWNFAQQWPRLWAKVCTTRLVPGTQVTMPAGVRTATSSQQPQMTLSPDPVVSVVVPHGGVERLPHLMTTLATLHQQEGRLEIIVVEMGSVSGAMECAQRWRCQYLFLEHDGEFERARSLNAGQAIASGELVLWLDNDLLLPPGFIARAVQELRERNLDFLTPYTSVRYLSAADSRGVMQGVGDAAACRPVNVLSSGTGASGGIGLVRHAFLQRHGGLVEGFRGWGGEDNAWNHKIALLGRAGCTRRRDQHVHHLYHPASGGYEPGAASRANPHYAANVELMRRVCAVRRPDEFATQFPVVPPASGAHTDCSGRAIPRPDTVWTYWEGPCPAWINACLRTLAAAAPTLRVLTPEAVDQLRNTDRDIDLSRLQVAHRADFIRLYLLQRYGGLWVDADCLAIHPLQGVLDLLNQHETIGHRERSGLASNGFIAARPGSGVVRAVYQRVCEALRSHRRLDWTSLGSEPLSAVIAEDASGWYELPCQRVQPICWSDPGAFFAERTASEHEDVFDGSALCYMLSNTRIRQHLARHPQADLMKESTFFSFLLRRALGPAGGELHADPPAFEQVFTRHAQLYRQFGDESISGPGSCLQQTRAVRERLPLLLAHLGVRTLIDAPCGDFNWMQHVEPGLHLYIGVDILTDMIAEHQWRHRRGGRRFSRIDLVTGELPRADGIFCRDLLPHLAYCEIASVLRNFAASGAVHLITTTFTGPRPNRDTSGGHWRTLNLTLPPFSFPPPLLTLNENCSESGGEYADKSLGVWRMADLPLTALLRCAAVATSS
jgi:hypothetical protein